MTPNAIADLLHATPFRPLRINHGVQSALVLHPEYAYQLATDRNVLIVAKERGGFFMFDATLINVEVLTPSEATGLANGNRGE